MQMQFKTKYELGDLIGKGSMSRVFRARDKESGSFVAVKFLSIINAKEEMEFILRFKREAEIISKLSHPKIIKIFSLFEEDNNFYLVMEYFEGKNLTIACKDFTLLQKVEVIKNCIEAIEYIHEKEIIHRDIKPANILVKSNGTIDLRVIDFGLAHLSNLSDSIKKGTLVGSLSYISPEQTGLLKRNIDNRSDLYSLGATFYDLLTGQPPFIAPDIGKLIHKHLAYKPIKPSIHNAEIPAILDDIILKLLSKDPNERYQTARGIREDLETFLKSPEKRYFKIGTKDKKSGINTFFNLIGREVEIKLLMESFTKANEGKPQISLLCGKSGYGKSKIVEHLRETIIDKNTFFLNYKCSHETKNHPYFPIIEMLNDYFKNIYQPQYEAFFIESLGDNIHFLYNLIPAFRERISLSFVKGNDNRQIEKQDSLFNALKTVLEVIGKTGRTPVLFIDDLQWADLDTVNFLYFISRNISETQLCFVLSVRVEEIQHNMLDMFKASPVFTYIPVGPISRQYLPELVREVLKGEFSFSENFLEKIYINTLGSPLHIIEILKTLFNDGYIFLEFNRWNINYEKLNRFDFKTDILKLLLDQLSELPEDVKEILTFCSVIGKEFNLLLITQLYANYNSNYTAEKILGIIDNCVKKQLIEENSVKGSRGIYYFVHDKIQQALYENIDSNTVGKLHLRIADILENFSKEKEDKDIYRIAYHYNKSPNRKKMLYYNKLGYKKAFSQYSVNETIYYLKNIVDYIVECKKFDSEFINYCISLGKFLQINGRIEESYHYLNNALENAKLLKLTQEQIDLLVAIGNGYYFSSNNPQAIAFYTQAIQMAEEQGIDIKAGIPYRLLGSVHFMFFNLRKAEYYVNKAIEKTPKEDLYEYLIALGVRSYINNAYCKFDKAKEDVEEIEKHLDKIKDQLVISQLHHMCSQYYSWSGENLKRAHDYAIISNENAKKCDNAIFEFSSLYTQLINSFFTGNLERAEEIFNEAIRLSDEKKIYIGIYIYWSTMALVNIFKNNFQKANEIAEKFLAQKDDIPDKYSLMIFYFASAVYEFVINNDAVKALEKINTAFIYYEKYDIVFGVIQFLPFKKLLLKILGEKKEYSECSGLIKEFLKSRVKINFLYGIGEKIVKIIKDAKNNFSTESSSFQSAFTVRQNIQLANIIKTSHIISSILDIDRLLDAIIEQTLETMGAERGALLLFDPEKKKLEFRSGKNIDVESKKFNISEKIINQVFQSKKGFVTSDAGDGQTFFTASDSMVTKNIRSVICAPLNIKGGTIGVLYLDSKLLDNLFSEEDLQILEVFSSQAAISIDNANAYKKLEQALKAVENEKTLLDERVKERTKELLEAKEEIEGINEISKEISMSLNFSGVFDKIWEYIKKSFPFEGIVLSLKNMDNKSYSIETLRLPEYLKFYEMRSKNLVYPLDEYGGKIGECILNKSIFIVPDVELYTSFSEIDKKIIQVLEIKSMVILPITIHNECLGVLSLTRHSSVIPFEEEDIESLNRFVNQIAILMRNSKLYDELMSVKNALEFKDDLITQDLRMAKVIQQKVLETHFSNFMNIKFYVHFQPMWEVGGDLYDIFELSPNYFRIFIADATGHGIQGALSTMIIKTEYDKIKILDILPSDILRIFNDTFIEKYFNLNVFFTCAILDININTNQIFYASAGHPVQYLVKQNETIALEASGALIGVQEKITFGMLTHPFDINDKIVLFTDGLFEEFSPKNEVMEEDRLLEIILRNKHLDIESLCKEVIKDVNKWIANSPINDDITLIGLSHIVK